MGQDLLLGSRIRCINKLFFVLLDQVEIVIESIKLMLAEWRSQVYYKRDRYVIEHVLVQILTQLLHALYQLVFGRDQRMVLKVIY